MVAYTLTLLLAVASAIPPYTFGSPEIYRLRGDVTVPVEVSRVQPRYPERAREERLSGSVVLEAIITEAGDVADVRALRSPQPLLDEAAREAVCQWRYEPARLGGVAVPVYLTIVCTFALPSPTPASRPATALCRRDRSSGSGIGPPSTSPGRAPASSRKVRAASASTHPLTITCRCHVAHPSRRSVAWPGGQRTLFARQ